MNLRPELLEFLMAEALKEAALASEQGEVPVGAVIAHQERIIARAHNEVEAQRNATLHAEMLAINRASKELGDWRLNQCILCATLEPCTMCAGAIKLARLPVVVFGAFDEQRGAYGSLFDLSIDSRLGTVSRVISGIQEDACTRLIKEFFAGKRKN